MRLSVAVSYFRALLDAYRQGILAFDVHTSFYFDDIEAFRDHHRGVCQRYFEHVRKRFDLAPTDRIAMKEPAMTALFLELVGLYDRTGFLVMTRDLREIVAS